MDDPACCHSDGGRGYGTRAGTGCLWFSTGSGGEPVAGEHLSQSAGRRQCPDLPPIFSSRQTSPMVMPRSTALHMS